jgi:hypothetical protein
MNDKTITLGGKDLPIRATPLAKLTPVFAKLAALDPSRMLIEKPEDMAGAALALGDAVFHGIRRAGGEVTQEWVHENIDLLNLEAVFTVFATVNGIGPKEAAS